MKRSFQATTSGGPAEAAHGVPGGVAREGTERCLRTAFLLALAAAGPLLAVAWTVFGSTDADLPKTKLLLLIAEYSFTLPLLAWLGWKHRGTADHRETGPKSAGPRFVFVALVYLACDIPLAAFLDRGYYQADEGSYLFQARCAAAGRLSIPVPASVPERLLSYEHYVMLNGKWFGKYTPGWPAVLGLGTLANLEWLVNPLLGLALVAVAYQASARFLPPGQRVYGAALLTLSPFFTLNCVGFMSHVLCGLLLACAALCYLRHEQSRRPDLWLFGMNACLGAGLLVRPFTAFCGGAVLAGAVLWKLGRRRRMRELWVFLGGGCLVALASAGLLGATNHALTGSYLSSPYALSNGVSGIPVEISFRIGDLAGNLTRIAPVRLADTCATSFPFVFLLAGYGLVRRPKPLHWLLAALFAAPVAGYLVNPGNSDSVIGERFYFETFFAAALLAGIGWAKLVRDCRWSGWFTKGMAMALCLVALADMGLGIKWHVDTRWPGRQMARAAERAPIAQGTAYLAESRAFHPEQHNFNRPGSGIVFAHAPRQATGPGSPAVPAEALDAAGPNCAVLSYDETGREANWASCGQR